MIVQLHVDWDEGEYGENRLVPAYVAVTRSARRLALLV